MSSHEEDVARMERALEVLRAAGRPLSEEAVAHQMGLAESEVSTLLYRLSLRGLARIVGSFGKPSNGGHGFAIDVGKGLWTAAEE